MVAVLPTLVGIEGGKQRREEGTFVEAACAYLCALPPIETERTPCTVEGRHNLVIPRMAVLWGNKLRPLGGDFWFGQGWREKGIYWEAFGLEGRDYSDNSSLEAAGGLALSFCLGAETI